MLKRIWAALLSSVVLCLLLAAAFGLTNHPASDTYHWSFGESFLFYLLYLLPPLLIGGALFSLIVDAATAKKRTALPKGRQYLLEFVLYALLGMAGGEFYVRMILGGSEPWIWLYGALISLLYFHVLLLLRKARR